MNKLKHVLKRQRFYSGLQIVAASLLVVVTMPFLAVPGFVAEAAVAPECNPIANPDGGIAVDDYDITFDGRVCFYDNDTALENDDCLAPYASNDPTDGGGDRCEAPPKAGVAVTGGGEAAEKSRCAIYGRGPVECPPGAPYDDKEKCFIKNLALSNKYVEDEGCEQLDNIKAVDGVACGTAVPAEGGEGDAGEGDAGDNGNATEGDAGDPESAGDTASARNACDPGVAACTDTSVENDRSANGVSQGTSCDLVKLYLNPLIKVLVALVGIGVTLGIIIGGIQYASSTDDPQKVAAAKSRITTALLVLVGSAVFYAFLNWLIPGGIG